MYNFLSHHKMDVTHNCTFKIAGSRAYLGSKNVDPLSTSCVLPIIFLLEIQFLCQRPPSDQLLPEARQNDFVPTARRCTMSKIWLTHKAITHGTFTT